MTSQTNQETIIHPVILCGGAGTRLWPVSRSDLPKQFIPLVTNRTMLQDTAMLVSDRDRYAAPTYLSGKNFRFFVENQIAEIDQDVASVILEPYRRNTAPAIALAAFALAEHGPNALMLVMPSDHVLENEDRFHECVRQAAIAARHGYLVTFGMEASSPETGFGYIHQGNALEGVEHGYEVKEFVEKPDIEQARKYIEDGSYHWNSGMFLLNAWDYLSELEKNHPKILNACKMAMAQAVTDNKAILPNSEAFAQAKDISIDYAIMEKTQRAAMVKGDFGWSDVGSWAALADLAKPADNKNAVVLKDCEDMYVRNEGGRVIAAIGLNGHIVVDTKDALLIAPKDRSQEVKSIVENLRLKSCEEADHHVCVHRPWGTFEGIHHGNMHQVKHIVVNPGGKLSAQYHYHRAEHWVIVSGEAEVTVGDETRLMYENESVYIPVEAIHRLFNPGKKPLHIIEVQYGDYLGEDDIVRLDDIYGRVSAVAAAE